MTATRGEATGAAVSASPVGGEGEGGAVERPPRPLRSLTIAVLVTTAVFALILAGSLYAEARYAFESSAPVELGDFASADLPAGIDGRFVRARVDLLGKPSLAFSRLGESDRRVSAAADTPRFVDYAVPEGSGPRFVAPHLVAGRLSRVGDLGLRYRGLATPLEALVPDASIKGWVLVDGEDPKSAAWVAGVEAVVVAFFLFNVVSLVRILKKRPVRG